MKSVFRKENTKNDTPSSSDVFRGVFSGSRRKRFLRKRLGESDEKWKKSKKTLDGLVRKLSVGKNLTLNSDGITFFAFQKFVVVIELPSDNPDVCFIYTMVYRLKQGEIANQLEVLKLAMELNYMQSGTRGATIGLEGEEVNLCYSCHVSGLTLTDLGTAVEDFLRTALEVNERLGALKQQKTIAIDSQGSFSSM